MSLLFSPITFRNIQLKNRLVVSPMCQYSSDDGFANDWHLVHLGSRAVGGAALVIAEATAVTPEGRITPDDLGIWKDEHVEFLQRITSFISSHGAVPGIQLAHAGRKASHTSPWKGAAPLAVTEPGGWQTVGPSALPFSAASPVPHELSPEEIKQVITGFKSAARRALQAGFKVVEIHAAHGYLLHSFYSPLSNHRTDSYGGSFENRVRLLLEVTDAIREVWPEEWPLFVRISATDWTEGGWTLDDSIKLVQELKQRGVDVIDCSTGGNSPDASIPAGPGYQVPFAEAIRQASGMPTGAVGIITTAIQAEEILRNGQADLILMARELLRNPYFPLRAALELGDEVNWPDQYLRAKRSIK
jgi:2,4-dienoyl-CoA reductase-like NADH-dependent reductase (Old Yellow Enzyme family)